MRNILIIGSEGFIGKHLRTYFENEKIKVVCCDVVSIQRENYYQLVNTQSDLSAILERTKFEVCINAAGSAHVQFSYSNHYNDFSLNSVLVFTILSCIKNTNPECRFLNFSSAAVYGNPAALPVSESQPTSPLSPYGWHKLYSEQICKEFFTFFNIPTISLRVFSAYGPGLRKQLFWDLYQKSRKSNVLNLYGTGHESRDFIYIDDITNAVQCILDNGEFNGDAINIGSGYEATISDVAKNYLSHFGKDTTVNFSGDIKEGDPLNWRANISILKSLGFEQKTSLDQGIKNYFDWIIKDQEHGS
ncbi:MAG: SDR family oxidoreductase [Bacteroidetes bacterium]|nr:SDR family oxidoreductase [Bacteroidota bacterium]